MLAPVGVVGCGTQWENLALELLAEWAAKHDINPSTFSGAVNLARRTASGSTRDEEADAAIDYGTIVEEVREAEEKNTDRGEGGTGQARNSCLPAHIHQFVGGARRPMWRVLWLVMFSEHLVTSNML